MSKELSLGWALDLDNESDLPSIIPEGLFLFFKLNQINKWKMVLVILFNYRLLLLKQNFRVKRNYKASDTIFFLILQLRKGEPLLFCYY